MGTKIFKNPFFFPKNNDFYFANSVPLECTWLCSCAFYHPSSLATDDARNSNWLSLTILGISIIILISQGKVPLLKAQWKRFYLSDHEFLLRNPQCSIETTGRSQFKFGNQWRALRFFWSKITVTLNFVSSTLLVP